MIVVTCVIDCFVCKNLRRSENGTLICSAFPDGIPNEILSGKKVPSKLKTCNNGIGFDENGA
jgi:hypothetical protein